MSVYWKGDARFPDKTTTRIVGGHTLTKGAAFRTDDGAVLKRLDGHPQFAVVADGAAAPDGDGAPAAEQPTRTRRRG